MPSHQISISDQCSREMLSGIAIVLTRPIHHNESGRNRKETQGNDVEVEWARDEKRWALRIKEGDENESTREKEERNGKECQGRKCTTVLHEVVHWKCYYIFSSMILDGNVLPVLLKLRVHFQGNATYVGLLTIKSQSQLLIFQRSPYPNVTSHF